MKQPIHGGGLSFVNGKYFSNIIGCLTTLLGMNRDMETEATEADSHFK
jgi:hypothetical protein